MGICNHKQSPHYECSDGERCHLPWGSAFITCYKVEEERAKPQPSPAAEPSLHDEPECFCEECQPDEPSVGELLKAVKDIKKSDCGGWMKDCSGGLFRCSDGRDKRMELGRLLHKLYKAAGI